MPEFLLAEQLASKLDSRKPNCWSLRPKESSGQSKNGRIYYSSRDFYRIKGVLHFMRTQGLSVDEAQDRVTNWNWFTQAAASRK